MSVADADWKVEVVTDSALADFKVEVVGGTATPGGAAGGDLGGTYPNPSLSAAKQAELDGKVSATSLSELVDDRVAALLTAGTGVTVTYNDAAGALTVGSSMATAFAFGG